ncbi:MAG: aldo/keto reductase [Spirochaetaceae bacterium]|nr:MAG: aldo/keto reductase [Spirochaetaceae bacterium]
MIYRNYGKTGKSVSAVGFGGMRFESIDEQQTCVDMMVRAAEGGINYFDTAPKYFGTRSEEAFGAGLAELRRRRLPYYLSTKTFESEESAVRREIEGQLERLGVDHIDFYHIWCITNLDNWRERKANGVLDTFRRLKEEGLIRHICVSSHLIGDQINELLMEGVFEGVLFGYSAYNFATRQKAFDAIRAHDLGCVVMNPLGGGLIPNNPDLFSFVKTQENESVVEAALRFLFAHREITVSLVGFGTREHVDQALAAVDGYKPISDAKLDAIKAGASANFEGICTGCQYCDGCPEEIPIPKLMDAYNQKLLHGDYESLLNRLKWHWNVPAEEAAKCIECGQCEEACTQHLDITGRLKEIVQAAAATG